MALDPNSITPEIRDYISRNFLFSDKGFQYGDDVSFLEEGIIDSLGIIELVAFVEKKFSISVADQELLPTNFDSVSRLSSFISGKLADAS
jgi:acyl carrier protein